MNKIEYRPPKYKSDCLTCGRIPTRKFDASTWTIDPKIPHVVAGYNENNQLIWYNHGNEAVFDKDGYLVGQWKEMSF